MLTLERPFWSVSMSWKSYVPGMSGVKLGETANGLLIVAVLPARGQCQAKKRGPDSLRHLILQVGA